MATHAETRILPYSSQQLYDLVADVERYPEFLPWVKAARIRGRQGNVFHADLIIGFKMIRERYTSRVTLTPGERVDVTYTKGPLKYLNNHWKFIPQGNGECLIDFYVDFEFRSRLLQRMIGMLFNEAVRRMVSSFEARARQLYGPGRARDEGLGSRGKDVSSEPA